jgi:DNA-binding MarR family transcriptional regulator
MPSDLQDELRQQKPFASLQHEAQLSVIRTGLLLQDAFERMLKPHGITGTQYNVLRILRGAEPAGLCRNELRDRMLTRLPDVTRLLDRMEEAGLIARSRESEDRRMVRTKITAKGRRLLDALDAEVTEEQRRPFGDLTNEELRTLIALLSAVRKRV